MSIPPLVCSTPPPPDQCEDDKDPEDFELSYSLSQEDDDDDDNNYNYGNFSSYNNFPSRPDNKSHEIKKNEITTNIEHELPKEIFLKYENDKENEHNNSSHDVFVTSDINENKLKCEEDLSIEDLNLKVDGEIENTIESCTEQTELSEPSVDIVKDYDIPSNSNNDKPISDNVSSFIDNTINVTDAIKNSDTSFVEQLEVPSAKIVMKSEPCVDNTEIDVLENTIRPPKELDTTFALKDSLINSEHETHTPEQTTKDSKSNPEENELDDDDFGDFDDFRSVNTLSNVTNVVESSSNPWENVDSNESDFRNFTATFEENKFHGVDTIPLEESISISNNVELHETETKDTDNDLDDDDFGDFDDYQSSSAKTETNESNEEETTNCHELPVLNLQSTESDHQIMESITKVLSSVFLEEITEPDKGFEGKLESLLSETWGHLMETDERQPYIVNWNNSLGQKTLLKALCIDSRNILFGPKWSSSMPKYAANLSNAPLQPQKQVSVPSSIAIQNEIVAEKSSSKPITWTDPFTSDGQEFTYAEALLLDLEHLMATLDQMAHNHSTLKISELLSHACNTENESSAITPGPTDLDVFEAAIPTKSDKIYSNTMSVQPLRQINLPDTHIFTPTDSEIPRSKTIHYDRGPTVLLPQPAMVENKNETGIVNTSNTNIVENDIDDNEYWEFQNFKSTSDTSSLPGSISNSQQQTVTQENKFETATTVNALPKPTIAYQTELLQPIKVEPAMPALNWPDPGEVKGDFDDFSDFVSISSNVPEKQDSSIQPVDSHLGTASINRLDNFRVPGDGTDITTDIKASDNDGFDDDFDTFQSALPSASTADQLKNNLENTAHQISTSQISEFGNGSPKLDSIKSDTISFPSLLRPNEALTQNVNYFSNTELTNKSSLPSGTQLPTNLLQPTPASFNTVTLQNQQKSAQILQPLSLESYSQINWPSPGIDLQDLSRFNPVETLHSLKSDLSVSGLNKVASPVHVAKNTVNQVHDDDVWGEFVSSKPKQQHQSQPKKPSVFVDDDEWTDFISSTSVKPQNGLNTISLNVHTNSNIQKSVQNKFSKKGNQPPLDIPTLNYITPKTNPQKSYNDKHFQNL